MATIHKLTKDGATIFPATITDAVVHQDTGKTLTSMIKEYNVSELFPTEGIAGGNTYNLALAVQVLGTHLRASEKTGGIKLTFISSLSNCEEEYYLSKNVWSGVAADWKQRFEVGDAIMDPTGEWEPSTAEEYIDQQISTVTGDLAAEVLARQTADTNLQNQVDTLAAAVGTGGTVDQRIQVEATTRANADTILGNRITPLEAAVGTGGTVDQKIQAEANTRATADEQLRQLYENLTQSDIIVGPRPSSGQLTNVIYREPDPDHTPPQFYSDYMWNGSTWVLMATYNNAIDNEPIIGSENLVNSKGIFDSLNFSFQPDLNILDTNGFFINTNGSYTASSPHKICFLPVKAGEGVKIVASHGNTVVGFVKNCIVVNGAYIPYSANYSDRIIIYSGDEFNAIVPSDCNYIVLSHTDGSGTLILPTVYLYKNTYTKELEYEVEMTTRGVVDISKYKKITPYYITTISNNGFVWYNHTPGNRGFRLIPVPERSNLVGLRTTGVVTNIAFLTTDNIDYTAVVPFAHSTRMRISSDTELPIPDDAKFLYVFSDEDETELNIGIYFKNTSINNVIGKESFGTFEKASNMILYSDMFIGSTAAPASWNAINNCSVYMINVPEGAKFLKVVANNITNGVLFMLQNNKAPVNGNLAELASGYTERCDILMGETYVFPINPDCKAVAVQNMSTKNKSAMPLFIGFATEPTSLYDEMNDGGYIIGGEIMDVEFNDSPVVCLSNKDNNANEYDNFLIGYACVVKISDSMYYMYYSCLGQSDPLDDNAEHLAFAYSEDGFNWTRGFPQGITPPIPGTNLLFNRYAVGSCVVKVPDSQYPFRMIASKWHESTTLYKSEDGINWISIKTYPYYYDNQPSIIVRGNLLRIYIRRRDGENRQDRYIGVVTCDLEGNVLTPPTIFYGKWLYHAAASPLDDRREIHFPTFFNVVDSTCHLECFIVDGNKIYPRDVDFSNIAMPHGEWHGMLPGIFCINNEFYTYMDTYSTLHDEPYTNESESMIKIVKITFVNTGHHWYPQP